MGAGQFGKKGSGGGSGLSPTGTDVGATAQPQVFTQGVNTGDLGERVSGEGISVTGDKLSVQTANGIETSTTIKTATGAAWDLGAAVAGLSTPTDTLILVTVNGEQFNIPAITK